MTEQGEIPSYESLSADDKQTQMFVSLIYSMHTAGMFQLGKMASPISGKVERDINQARYTIDLLDMLYTKTKGNLSSEEESLLKRFLSELRMNYLDELNKPATEPSAASDSQSAEA